MTPCYFRFIEATEGLGKEPKPTPIFDFTSLPATGPCQVSVARFVHFQKDTPLKQPSLISLERGEAQVPKFLKPLSDYSPADLPPRSVGEISLVVILRCAGKALTKKGLSAHEGERIDAHHNSSREAGY